MLLLSNLISCSIHLSLLHIANPFFTLKLSTKSSPALLATNLQKLLQTTFLYIHRWQIMQTFSIPEEKWFYSTSTESYLPQLHKYGTPRTVLESGLTLIPQVTKTRLPKAEITPYSTARTTP